MESMNADLLNLHKILDIQKPVSLRATAGAWVRESLKEVGWKEGGAIPGQLPEYFGAVFQTLGLPSRPDSVRAALKHPEVLLTLQSAVRKIQEKENALTAAEESLGDQFRITDEDQGVMRQIKEAAIQAEVDRIQSEARILEDEASEEELEEELEELEEPKPSPLAINNAQLPPAVCPCCKWNLSQEYTPAELDLSDQRAYLVYVLGGPAFTKTYSCWGGLCQVTFKTSSSEEEELFIELFSKEQQEQKLNIIPVANRKFNQYHTALSLKAIQYAPEVQLTAPVVPSVWSFEFNPDTTHTRLEYFMEKWYNRMITSVELQQELIEHWKEFNRLLIRLQQELYDKDFWHGPTSA